MVLPPAPGGVLPDGAELAGAELAGPELAGAELAGPELAGPEDGAELPATGELAAEDEEPPPLAAADEDEDDDVVEAVVLELPHAAVTSIAAQPAATAALFVQRIWIASFRLVLLGGGATS